MLRRYKSPSSIGIDCKGFERGRFPQTLASPREPKRTLQSKFGTRSPKKKPNEEANDRQLLGFLILADSGQADILQPPQLL